MFTKCLCSGVYGHADYEVMLPLLLVHLPSSPVVQQGSLYHCLPEDLQAVLNVGMIITVYMMYGAMVSTIRIMLSISCYHTQSIHHPILCVLLKHCHQFVLR